MPKKEGKNTRNKEEEQSVIQGFGKCQPLTFFFDTSTATTINELLRTQESKGQSKITHYPIGNS